MKNISFKIPIVKFNLLFFCLFFLNISYAQNYTPEEKVYKQMMDGIYQSELPDTIKFVMIYDSIYHKKNTIYYKSQLPFQYAHHGLGIAKRNKDLFWEASFNKMLGFMHCNTMSFDSSALFLNEALSLYEQNNNKSYLPFSHGLLRYVYSQKGDYDLSLKHCYKLLDIYQTNNDEEGIGETYNDIAGTLIEAGKYEDALDYANKGKDILIKYVDGSSGLYEYIMTLSKTARCYKNLNHLEKAVKVYNESLKLAIEYPIPVGRRTIANLFKARSSTFEEMNLFDKALKDIQEAKTKFVDKTDKIYYALLTDQEAKILMKIDKYKDAKNKYVEILKIDETSIQEEIHPTVYEGISKCYANLSKYDSAYFYHVKHFEYIEKLNKKESILEMEELLGKYEAEKKDAEIQSQALALIDQKRIRNLILSIAGLLGGFLIFVYRNSLARKQTNNALLETNNLLDIKNQQNEILLKEIHHRVKNNLQTISSLLSLQSRSIDDPNALDAVKESQNRVASMALIHQKLYQGENLAAIEMSDYFETIGKSIISSFNGQTEKIDLEIDMPEIELDVDTAIPIGLITNELITNSMKYAFQEKEKGKIFISMKKDENDLIQLQIKDDGINNSTSVSEGGTGFGTMLINLLTTQLGGQLKQSTEQGTSTIIQFPLTTKAA